MIKKAIRYYDTIKWLRSTQIIGQIIKPFIMKSRCKPIIYDKSNKVSRDFLLLIPELDTDEEYLSRFLVEDFMRDEYTLLHETHMINFSTWKVDASPLWKFNLHYFEYTIALATKYKQTADVRYYTKFKRILNSWIAENPIGSGVAWHPYTISMRIPNLLVCFDLYDEIFENDFEFYERAYESIYIQYRILMKRIEIWQLGNHYFENLKTILICSLIFNEYKLFKQIYTLFLREIKEEISHDGVHFELSLMYHKIILEDIIRVAYILKQIGNSEYELLLPVIQKMTDAMYSLEYGMDKTPLFNDSGNNVAKSSEQLCRAVKELFQITPNMKDSFTNSGYYKLYDGNIALMFDCGKIGPDYMPGHGHCDCLSFELSVDNRPLFVNSGSYQYQGNKRGYFRSTRAHNTVVIGKHEQSECWGEHRVARRIYDIHAEKNGQMLIGQYRNYIGERHIRILSLVDRVFTVLDSTETKEKSSVHSYLHIAPGHHVGLQGDAIIISQDDDVICEIFAIKCKPIVHTIGELSCYSPEFGMIQKAVCIEFTWKCDAFQHGYMIKIIKKED